MIGRSLMRDIASTTSLVNVFPLVLTPIIAVGLRSSITETKSVEGAWGWAYGTWKTNKSVRLGSSKPLMSKCEIRDRAWSRVRPSSVIADAIRSAIPIPADPAPRKNSLIAKFSAGNAKCIQNARQRHSGGTLNVVVVARHLIPIALEQPLGVHTRPVLEMNAAAGEHLLDSLDKFIYELVPLSDRDSRLTQAQIQRVIEQFVIICAEIHVHGKEVLWGHAGTGRVKLEFADRNPHAVRAQIAESQNAFTGGDAYDAHILFRPVLEDHPHVSLVLE